MGRIADQFARALETQEVMIYGPDDEGPNLHPYMASIARQIQQVFVTLTVNVDAMNQALAQTAQRFAERMDEFITSMEVVQEQMAAYGAEEEEERPPAYLSLKPRMRPERGTYRSSQVLAARMPHRRRV